MFQNKKFTSFFIAIVLLFSTFSIEGLDVFAATVNKTYISSIKAASATSITLKWKKASGVNGYVIYQKKAGGSYKKVATIKSGSTVSYTKKSLASATKYTYKIRAYKIKNGKAAYSAFCAEKSTYTLPKSPTLYSVEPVSKTSLKLKWEKVPRAAGYVVYRKVNGKYKKIATIKKGSTTEYTVKNLKSGSKYYFYVKAYIKTWGKTRYSSRSTIKSCRTYKTYGAASLAELKSALSSSYMFSQKQVDYMNLPMFRWAYYYTCNQATVSSPAYRDTVEIRNQLNDIINIRSYAKFKIKINKFYKCDFDLYSTKYLNETRFDNDFYKMLVSEKKKIQGIWVADYTIISNDGVSFDVSSNDYGMDIEEDLFIYKIDGRYYWSYIGIYV